MRVLLISPLDPDVPLNLKFLMGGENTYTRTLLANPPPGVTYVHHTDALKKGEVRYGSFHAFLRTLVKFRILPLSAGTVDVEILGKFDLVNCHAYTLRLSGSLRHIPVVMGDSIPNRWGLSQYFGQGRLRIEATYGLRRAMHSLLSVYDQDLSLGNFSKLLVMSEFAKQEHIALGADPAKIAVIYPGLSDRAEPSVRKVGPVRLLFAGVWFERKGGMILWEAYRKVREMLGDTVRLTILGPVPKNYKLQMTNDKSYGITQHDFVSYDRLVSEFYPAADILVHVPPKAEGYGLVVCEAMSFGIPVVASRLGALPEMVVDGQTGLLVRPGSVGDLAEALERLVLDADLRGRLGQAARRRYLAHFSLSVMQKKLFRIYEEAIED